MRIGYLMNTYPVTSGTFIRREIAALEALGLTVSRYAVRRWSEPLVDVQDQAEQERTRYLLSGRALRLPWGLMTELLRNPLGLMRALGTWGRLLGDARGGVIRHTAYLLEAIALRRMAQAEDVAHIHAHFSTNAAAVALLCHRLGGPGYSFTAHGPDEFVDWGPSGLAQKVAGARFVVAISHYCAVQLARAAGPGAWEKIHVVRCGLDLEEFDPESGEIAADAPFVCVGRLCPQKAQTLIVAATAQVARTHPQIRLVLIGDGESRAAVEAVIAEHGLEEQVQLLGWQDNAAVRAHLGAARALLLPSFAEGLPIVIMEAMALKRPVISTYIAGIPELLDATCGWIIPAGSAEHIAAAMRAALDSTPAELAALGAEGRRRVEAQHDITKSAAQLAALFEAAVKDAQ